VLRVNSALGVAFGGGLSVTSTPSGTGDTIFTITGGTDTVIFS
jgi:hypothetical protein